MYLLAKLSRTNIIIVPWMVTTIEEEIGALIFLIEDWSQVIQISALSAFDGSVVDYHGNDG